MNEVIETAEEPVVDPVENTDNQESDQVEIEEATTSDSDTTAEPQKKQKGVQKRIDELTRNYRETERDRDYWRQMAMQNQPKEPEPKTVPDTGEPKLEQYDDYDDYIIAKTTHQIEKKQQVKDQQREAEQAQQAAAEHVQEFQQHLTDARVKYNDFDEVAFNPSIPYSEAMTDLVMTSEQGSDIAYYLGQHPEDAQRIARLSDRDAAREIGRLEVRVSIPQPKTISNAPEPPSTVGSKETVAKDPSKMNTDEWMEWRHSQLR